MSAPPTSGPLGASPSSSTTATDQLPPPATDSRDRLTELAELLAASDVERGLITWGRQATGDALTEAEHYVDFESASRAASAVVVARVIGPGPERVLQGDPGTDDVVVYQSTIVDVVETLAGTRPVPAGTRLVVEGFVAATEDAAGTVALPFLRNKQDRVTGEPDPNALDGERDLWRLVSHQGVFLDRGDGVPVNPISEVIRLVESGADMPLDEFVFSDNVPDPRVQPLAAQARELTMLELLELVAGTAVDPPG